MSSGDALGSVRQWVDGDGAVTLAKSYEPFGQAMDSAGSGTSDFGFTGEMQMGGLTLAMSGGDRVRVMDYSRQVMEKCNKRWYNECMDV
ncbi:MAG: hypothetical protein AB1894_29220 [Chloroflexota bacterium]